MSTAEMCEPTEAMLEEVDCYFCGASQRSPFLEADDDYTGKPGRFHFVTCEACGLVYQNPRIKLEHITKYYDDEYISHRHKTDWGVLTWFYNRGMAKHDRDKDRLVSRYVSLNRDSQVLDIGCAAATFLQRLQKHYGAQVSGVDFKDLSALPGFESIDFHCGTFEENEFAGRKFDLVTMWHFLEHDYDPIDSLESVNRLLADDGRLVVEVPRLDSLTFRMYGDRWPGLQAPQHTVLFRKQMLLRFMDRAGLEVVDYLPYGAFPPYFYVFAGLAFKYLQGRGIDLGRAIYPYFLGQVVLSPILLFARHLNLAMQTVVCKRRG